MYKELKKKIQKMIYLITDVISYLDEDEISDDIIYFVLSPTKYEIKYIIILYSISYYVSLIKHNLKKN